MKRIKSIIIFLLISSSCLAQKNIGKNNSISYKDSIYSQYLNEYRFHKIYLPKDFSEVRNYKVIYATDGNSETTEIKAMLDSLIDNRIIEPIIFVASFYNEKIAESSTQTYSNGEIMTLTYRNFEYARNSSKMDTSLNNRFDNHLKYFTKEFIPNIENQFKNIDSTQRTFYGFSNGAGFGLYLLNRFPKMFKTFICFSPYGGEIRANPWYKKTQYPDLYLSYGTQEPPFLKDDAKFISKKYRKAKSFIKINEFEGGHPFIYWKNELINTIIKLFKTK